MFDFNLGRKSLGCMPDQAHVLTSNACPMVNYYFYFKNLQMLLIGPNEVWCERAGAIDCSW